MTESTNATPTEAKVKRTRKPKVEAPPPPAQVEVSPEAIRSAFAHVLHTVEKDNTRPILGFVHADGENIVAADGFRLAVHPSPLGKIVGNLSPRDIDFLSKLGTDPLTITQTAPLSLQVETKAGSIHMIQLFDGTFPNYKQILPTKHLLVVDFPSAGALRALVGGLMVREVRERAAGGWKTPASYKTKKVYSDNVRLRIWPTGDVDLRWDGIPDIATLRATATDPNVEPFPKKMGIRQRTKAEDERKATWLAREPLVIGFNPVFLVELLSQLPPGSPLTIGFGTHTSPMLLTCKTYEGWAAVIMPKHLPNAERTEWETTNLRDRVWKKEEPKVTMQPVSTATPAPAPAAKLTKVA